MARSSKTKSESLFEEFCADQAVQCNRLPVLSGGQQPDYEVVLQGRRVAVEVKQIEPNESDLAHHCALAVDGYAGQSRNPNDVAERVRKHIKESRSQLRSYLDSHPGTPSLLVLFDNADNRYTDSYVIQTALHGFEHVVFRVGTGGQEPAVLDRGFAPRNDKALRAGVNEHLSAVVTLHEYWELQEPHERGLGLQFYHNPFAAYPFDPEWWFGECVGHCRISEKVPGKYQDWELITPGQIKGRQQP